MKTYPIRDETGKLCSFEIDNFLVGPRIIARYLTKQPGISNIRKNKFDDEDTRLEFEFRGQDFYIWEPWGDSSRYWIGPKNLPNPLAEVEDLEKLILALKVPLHRKLIFLIIVCWFVWDVGSYIYSRLSS